MKESVNTAQLGTFLLAANRSTYANKAAPKAPSSRLRSSDYHFQEGDFTYHDTYFGARDFIGEEIVYKNDVPVWGENYFGFVLVDTFTNDQVYDFLRKALMQEYSDILPVRGPASFIDKEWEYRNHLEGDLKNFKGGEQILFSGTMVYQAYYHGGLIRS